MCLSHLQCCFKQQLVFSVLFSTSIAETWKNCLDGATDFKEVNNLLVLQSVAIGFLYVANLNTSGMSSKNEFPFNRSNKLPQVLGACHVENPKLLAFLVIRLR